MGIEPTLFAWEARVLPLNDARVCDEATTVAVFDRPTVPGCELWAIVHQGYVASVKNRSILGNFLPRSFPESRVLRTSLSSSLLGTLRSRLPSLKSHG